MSKHKLTIVGPNIKFRRSSHGLGQNDTLVVEVDGDPVIRVEDLNEKFVRVRLGRNHWTYRDPSGRVKIGDRVLVPFGYDNAQRVGIVESHGRGGYEGDTKDVIGLVAVEELV